MKAHDGGPLKTFLWQLVKALLAALVVIAYSRGMGAHGRGTLSILLLYLQLALMVSELFAGGALANLLSKYPAKRILPTAWFFLLFVLLLGYAVGWYAYVLPNQGALPLNFDQPHIVKLNLLFFQGLFLGSLGIQYNVYQVKGWVQQRNQLQVMLEALKLIGIALCFEAMYGILIPKMAAIELSVQAAQIIPANQTIHYVNGFDETAVLWILVYASGLVCFVSLWYLWNQQRQKIKRDRLGVGLNDNHAAISLQPPTEMFRSGFMSQIGHILLFLLYRLPLWWMAAEFGHAQAGVLANALLMADTIWIFGNSYGTILHSRMLREEVHSPKFSGLLANYVVISGLGTFVAIAIAWLLPVDLYTWVFGQTFSTLKETFCLISPAVLFLGLSAPIGHYLHAQNRFKALILSYGLSLLVLVVGWNGTSIALMSGKVSTGLMANVIHYLQAYMGKLMSVNVSFFVLLLSNYLQVRKDIKWQRMSFKMSDFNQDRLTN